MGQLSYLKTRDTSWKKVAVKHRELFEMILGKRINNSDLYKQLIS
jgi:hypothetical protein